jgi:hypothetical protein
MRYVGRFSRESEVAFRTGTVAVQDRAYAVCHYGCALLAACRRSSDSKFAVKTRRPPHGGRCQGGNRRDKRQASQFLQGPGHPPHPRSTALDVTKATSPFQGVIGVISQTRAAIPAMALATRRNTFHVLRVLEGSAPARKLYPQSQRSILSGLTNSQLGHSFIEEVVCLKTARSLRRAYTENAPKSLICSLIGGPSRSTLDSFGCLEVWR